MGWRQVSSEMPEVRMSSTMTMETDQPAAKTKIDSSTISQEHMLFTREARGAHIADPDTDWQYLQEGYITVTPLGALSDAEMDCQVFFKDWLPSVTECSSSSAL